MMIGSVNASREAIVRIAVKGPAGRSRTVDTVLDTGFNGDLSLEPRAIAALGLVDHGTEFAELADRIRVEVRRFHGRVLWQGVERNVIVLEMDGAALLGMSLFENTHLGIDVVAGGHVTILPLP